MPNYVSHARALDASMKRVWQLLFIASLLTLMACEASTVKVSDSDLGRPSTEAEMVESLARSGPIVFTKHVAAHWSVPLSGLLNLDHPASQAAGIEDRQENIEIYVYSLIHPEKGTFIIDSGVAESFADTSDSNEASWIVESFMNIAALDVVKSTKTLKQELGGIDGVFLTHIHTDHIMGLPDLFNTEVYGGPNDAELSAFTHAFTQGTTDRLLRNVDTLKQWQFDETGIVDVFGDGSLWAIHTPGHTPGATAYLANTVNGPELMIGDATHTSWGWENGVEPGTYSHDIAESKVSLAKLKRLAQENPSIRVHPGHQSL